MLRSRLLFSSAPVLVLMVAVGCGGCGSDVNPSGGLPTNGSSSGGPKLTGTIDIDGSSTVYRLTAGAYELFQEVQPEVQIPVNYSGTGSGFKKFLEGKLDIADASRPIQQSEIDQAKEAGIEYIELPVAFDALTIAVNAENDWATEITIDELKKLWEPGAKDTITKWNQIREGWPDKEIKLFGAGHDSGTYEYFTEAVVGKKGSARSDATATEDDNIIVQGVAGDKFSLGYLPYAYYEPNKDKLKALKIDWKSDDEVGAIEPSVETVRAGQYNPLSRPLFIYVKRSSAERPEVKAFVEFYLAHAAELSKSLQYVPLPDAAYTMAQERFAKLQVGTGFGGKSEFGLPLEEIMKREPKL
jgi:phosphate transport system substrate-binding protein